MYPSEFDPITQRVGGTRCRLNRFLKSLGRRGTSCGGHTPQSRQRTRVARKFLIRSIWIETASQPLVECDREPKLVEIVRHLGDLHALKRGRRSATRYKRADDKRERRGLIVISLHLRRVAEAYRLSVRSCANIRLGCNRSYKGLQTILIKSQDGGFGGGGWR